MHQWLMVRQVDATKVDEKENNKTKSREMCRCSMDEMLNVWSNEIAPIIIDTLVVWIHCNDAIRKLQMNIINW